jgi:hypothetical protein
MPRVFDPHSGGVKLPTATQERVRQRLLEHAASNYAGRYTRLEIQFRGAMCYIDACIEPSLPPNWELPDGQTREQFIERLRATPTHLCRLRHFSEDCWSLAFYTHSDEKYRPCFFKSNEFFGTPEEGLDVGAMYLS